MSKHTVDRHQNGRGRIDGKRANHSGLLHDQRVSQIVGDCLTHVFLAAMAVIWLLPIVWILLESFNSNTAPYQTTFFPRKYTFANYVKLFSERNVMNFPRMFMNTLFIACFVCVISLFFVLSIAFCMSRLRFRGRRTFMNIALVLGMFPGIMAVIAIYFILKAFGLTSGSMVLLALILVYSAGSGAGFYVMKGYMDTIPNPWMRLPTLMVARSGRCSLGLSCPSANR